MWKKRSVVRARIGQLREMSRTAKIDRDILLAGPIDKDHAEAKALNAAQAFHNILWDGIPSGFGEIDAFHYAFFKSKEHLSLGDVAAT